MESNYNYSFQVTKNQHTDDINLFDFLPRSQAALDNFIKKNQSKNIYYIQKTNEGFNSGKIYSYFLYSPDIEFKLRNNYENKNNFKVEFGIPEDKFYALKELAISQNKNEVIFPNSFLENFKANSILISDNDLSVQIYDGQNLVGHASVIKTKHPLFKSENLYLLMRFIVHEEYRTGNVKEILMKAISDFIPKKSALCLQVFPHNIVALRFFLRRMNVSIAYEKWNIE